MNNNVKFVTTINCMDGRVQLPVNSYMTGRYGADFVDTITEAGPNKILSDMDNEALIASIKARYEVSTLKHLSKTVAVVGHFDCGGNPSEMKKQLVQISKSCEEVEKWNKDVEVIGLWVNEQWQVELVYDKLAKLKSA